MAHYRIFICNKFLLGMLNPDTQKSSRFYGDHAGNLPRMPTPIDNPAVFLREAITGLKRTADSFDIISTIEGEENVKVMSAFLDYPLTIVPAMSVSDVKLQDKRDMAVVGEYDGYKFNWWLI